MSATVDHMPEASKLYIGERVIIKGAAVTADTVVVDGVLEGDIAAHNLIVSSTGTISGRISVAGNAEISGTVLERLEVKGLLVLRSSGRIDGHVSFGTLTIEQGATVTGEISSADYRINQQSSYRAQQPAAKVEPKEEPERRDDVGVDRAVSTQPLELSPLDLIPGPFSLTA
jgi:cytoskeletal protein CcmA (bactofilin family)